MYKSTAVPLNHAAIAILESASAPTNRWFRKFYVRHVDRIKEAAVFTDSAKRIDMHTYSVAREHLVGLDYELQHHPIIKKHELDKFGLPKIDKAETTRLKKIAKQMQAVEVKMASAMTHLVELENKLKLLIRTQTRGNLPLVKRTQETAMHVKANVKQLQVDLLALHNSKLLEPPMDAKKTIINRNTLKFQSGDLQFMAKVAKWRVEATTTKTVLDNVVKRKRDLIAENKKNNVPKEAATLAFAHVEELVKVLTIVTHERKSL